MEDVGISRLRDPPGVERIGPAPARLAEAPRGSEDVSIVAIGSSSTVGEGASSSENSYPNKLVRALSDRFSRPEDQHAQHWRKRSGSAGRGALFNKGVLPFKPALVIWQVGTNAAWKDYFLDDVGAAILRAARFPFGADADLVLMSLRCALAVLDQRKSATTANREMLHVTEIVAVEYDVALSHRFRQLPDFSATG